MGNIFENVVYIITFVVAAYIFGRFRPNKELWKKIVALALSVAIVILQYYADIIYLRLTVQVAGLFLVLIFIFNENIKSIINFTILFTILHTVISQVVRAFLFSSEILMKKKMSIDKEMFTCILVLLVLILFGILIHKYTIIGTGKVKKKYTILISSILITNCIILILIGEYIMNMDDSKFKVMASYVYILIVLEVVIEIVVITALAASRNRYKEREELVQKHLEAQKEHYEYLSIKEYETKRFRHDLISHMNLLAQMCEDKNLDGVKAYLHEVNVHIKQLGNAVNTHNEIADAIFNRYVKECEINNIELKVEGHFPANCNLSAYDMCTILSNLLDNAVKAEIESGSREIQVKVRNTDDDKIIIIIENDFKSKVKQEKGIFLTTKSNKYEHGYGLENVKECVRRNNGVANITTENNKFKVSICMGNGIA